jgi:hypothetical protein
LYYVKEDFLHRKTSRLAEGGDLANAYAEIIVAWALEEEEVLHFLVQGQEAPSLGAAIASRRESGTSILERGSSLSTFGEEYQDFISSLEPDGQHFVFAVACCRDLLLPVFERMRHEIEIGAFNFEDRWERMQTVITNSGLHPATLFAIVEKASIAYSISLGGWPKGGIATEAQRTSPQKALTTQEVNALQAVSQELRVDFDNIGDSLDSLKAGQMEIMRMYEYNRRSAEAYEPFIAAQIGEVLYSRLDQMTRRALQVAEYLYKINQEPDGFGLFAVRMAQGYEKELNVRIIEKFVNELLAAGKQTYDAREKFKIRQKNSWVSSGSGSLPSE